MSLHGRIVLALCLPKTVNRFIALAFCLFYSNYLPLIDSANVRRMVVNSAVSVSQLFSYSFIVSVSADVGEFEESS